MNGKEFIEEMTRFLIETRNKLTDYSTTFHRFKFTYGLIEAQKENVGELTEQQKKEYSEINEYITKIYEDMTNTMRSFSEDINILTRHPLIQREINTLDEEL